MRVPKARLILSAVLLVLALVMVWITDQARNAPLSGTNNNGYSSS